MSPIAVAKRKWDQMLVRREWEPVRLLRQMLNRDPFRQVARVVPTSPDGEVSRPAFELQEIKDIFIFRAELPDVAVADLEVAVAADCLTVSGRRKAEDPATDDTPRASPCSDGSFMLTFRLLGQIDAAHVKAELKLGVLTIAVPKPSAAVATRIPIEAGETTRS